MIRQAANFAVEAGWRVLLKDLGISPQDLLRHARLPLDLFERPSPSLTTTEYFRFWQSLEVLLSSDPAFPLRVAQAVSVEAFSPPIFACVCSENINAAFERLAQYKPLIGPLRLSVTQSDRQTAIALCDLPGQFSLPSSFVATELVFFVHLARLATREPIVPLAVQCTTILPAAKRYEDFFGTRIQVGKLNSITFSAADAKQPFLTANESMWSIFEPELRRRMVHLDVESRFCDRVRACLLEILAGGQCSIADVSRRLAVHNRTLQRRLQSEDTSFQQELNNLREELANHYLGNTAYSSAEIAFLLGYNDPSSFFRAFHTWTGKTPEAVREILHP